MSLLLTDEQAADFAARFAEATGIELAPAEQATIFPCPRCGCLFWPDADGGWWPDRLQPMASHANGLAPNCADRGDGTVADPGCRCHTVGYLPDPDHNPGP